MQDLKNKVAVITGAASGLGEQFARLAAREGMRLVLADIQADALSSLVASLRETGTDLREMVCDVSQSAQVKALADLCMKEFGVAHLLFNNAGVGTGGLIWENTEADWDWVLGVNLKGVINGIRHFTPLMLAAQKEDSHYRAHIVNTASVAGILNTPNLGVYNVSKHAVVSLSETLYQDLQLIDAAIGVSVLCPYFVQTGIANSARNRPENYPAANASLSQLTSEQMIKKATQHGSKTAEEIASITFDAISKNQFYIFTHPEVAPAIQQRFQDIQQAKNPADPFERTPEMRAKLRAAIVGHKTSKSY